MRNKQDNIYKVGITLQMDLAYSISFFHLHFQKF